MIDEKLQMQEAKRKNIVATPDELKKAVASIAKQNHMEAPQLEAVLKARGIALSALTDQLTASIEWAKLVRQLAAEANPVSDEEIDDTLKRIKQSAGEPQTRVAEIFLAVDNPQQDDEVRQLAVRLTEQMKQGARFSAVAQQFSQSATAAVGGDLGWIRPESLRPELAKAVVQMQPGELSPPIRTPAGYYLLLVLDRRNDRSAGASDPKLHIVQVVFPLPPQATETQRRAAIAEAESARQAAKNCPEMLRIGKERAPQLSSEGDLRLAQIAPAMRSMVLGLGIGQASQPIVEKNGVGVIMVCSKTEPGQTAAAGAPTRDDVAESLMRQRLDILARRYLRDLRRAAFVDVRV
jgi:peptidyl-prolyl cis-trans isomerase SurA